MARSRIVCRSAAVGAGASRVAVAVRHRAVRRRRSLGHGRCRGVERPVLFRAPADADRQYRHAARRRPAPAAVPARSSSITAPDGSQVEAQNGTTGRYRSTFDVPLKQKGTYKLALINEGVFASYKEGGQVKRWRGSAENFAKEVPQNAEGPAGIVPAEPDRDLRDLRQADQGDAEDHRLGPGTCADHASERHDRRHRGRLPADARRQAGEQREDIGRAGRQPLSRQARRDEPDDRCRRQVHASNGRSPACTGWKRWCATKRRRRRK